MPQSEQGQYTVSGKNATFATGITTGSRSRKVALFDVNNPGRTIHMSPEEAVRFGDAMISAAFRAVHLNEKEG